MHVLAYIVLRRAREVWPEVDLRASPHCCAREACGGLGRVEGEGEGEGEGEVHTVD